MPALARTLQRKGVSTRLGTARSEPWLLRGPGSYPRLNVAVGRVDAEARTRKVALSLDCVLRSSPAVVGDDAVCRPSGRGPCPCRDPFRREEGVEDLLEVLAREFPDPCPRPRVASVVALGCRCRVWTRSGPRDGVAAIAFSDQVEHDLVELIAAPPRRLGVSLSQSALPAGPRPRARASRLQQRHHLAHQRSASTGSRGSTCAAPLAPV